MAKMFRLMIFALPVVLFFSYQPLIHFAASESMNFEISLPLLWLVLFDLLVVVMMIKRRILWKGLKGKWAWLLFPLFLSFSVLWSLNSLRGLLTVGVLWLIYVAVYGCWSLRNLFSGVGFKETFWKVFFGTSLVICGWCFLQCILDLAGVGREYSLMCVGCTYSMFGFPHPNGFAIEPQFMGNLLLAPAIVAAWMYIKKQINRKLKLKRSRRVVLTAGQADSAPNCSSGSSSVPAVKTTTGSCFLGSNFLLVCFFIFSATLFLTFSRGAIYAFLVALLLMTVAMVVRAMKKEKKMIARRGGVIWVLTVMAFLLSLGAQGIMAEVSPTNDTFQSGVSKVLNHLSLGVIDVRGDSAAGGEEVVGTGAEDELTVEKSVENSEEKGVENEAVFDGYVAESTETRLRLSGAAMEVWSYNFTTVVFGVGLGGAGQALYANGLTSSPKEIVQNQYVSLLLETGLLGVLLLALSLVLIIKVVWHSEARIVILALIVAYMITLCFFSGLPNALQVYLLPVLLMCFRSDLRVFD